MKFFRFKSLPLSFLLSLAWLPWVGVATAADEEEVPTIVITATREPLSMERLPNSVSVLGEETLLERQVRTLPEALSETPSVMVQKTSYGQGSPYIRGFTGYRNLALIDGIRLNNSVFREGPNQYWNTIDPFSLRRIELVRGQGSVLFGSDAIGGTLNALTIRPVYRSNQQIAAFGRAFTRLSSAEESIIGRFESGFSQKDRFGIVFGATGKYFGDLDSSGLGRQPKTGYEEWDIDAKLEWFPSETTRLTLMPQQAHQDDAWRTHRTIFGKSWRGTDVGAEQERSLDQDRYLTYLQLAGEPDGLIDDYLISLSHQRQQEEQYRIRRRGDGRRDLQGFTVDTLGIWGQASSDSPIGHLTYGASYYHDWVDSFLTDFNSDGSFRRNRIQGPVADDATYQTAAVFLQDRVRLFDRLDLWLGGRLTYARTDAGRVEDPATGAPISISDEWFSALGSIRANYALSESYPLNLIGGISQGFRAPNLSDLTRFDTARSDEIEIPSPGLDPEQFVAYEIGLRAGNGRKRAEVAYYYTSISDQITGVRTGAIRDGSFVVTKENAGDGYVHGIEFDGEYEFLPGWSVFGWMSWQDGEVEVGGERDALSRIMPLSGQGGVRWESGDGRFQVEAFVLGAVEQDNLPARDQTDTQRIPPGGTPGYLLGTVRGSWQVTRNFRLNAAMENITNEEYRVHGSGVNGPGRNFLISGELRF